jgi:hypothetical protein
MTNEADTEATPTDATVRGVALLALHDVVIGLGALARLTRLDPPDDARETDELMHALRIVAEDLQARARRIARALDCVPGPRERLAMLQGGG